MKFEGIVSPDGIVMQAQSMVEFEADSSNSHAYGFRACGDIDCKASLIGSSCGLCVDGEACRTEGSSGGIIRGICSGGSCAPVNCSGTSLGSTCSGCLGLAVCSASDGAGVCPDNGGLCKAGMMTSAHLPSYGCEIVDGCIQSKNFPGNYGGMAECHVLVGDRTVLDVQAFSLDVRGDILTVNGVEYTGTVGPDLVVGEAGSKISFSTGQYYGASGFRVCGAIDCTSAPFGSVCAPSTCADGDLCRALTGTDILISRGI